MYSDNISTGNRGRGRGRGGSHYGGGSGSRSSGGFDESRLGPTNDYDGSSKNPRNNSNNSNWNANNNNGNNNSNNNNNNFRAPRNNRNNNFNTSNQGNNQSLPPNPAVVEINNYIGNNENSLADFLKKRASMRVEILAIRSTENGRIQMLTSNLAQAKSISLLSNTSFSGRNLTIQLMPKHVADKWTQEFDSGTPNLSVDTWIKVMTPRYNPSARLLDLSKIESEPLVIQHNLLGGRPFNNQICTVLIRIISQHFPDIVSISFDNNYIEKLSDFSAMNQFLPNVQNLSFRNNRLMTMKDLEGLCLPGELPQLTELLLFDNPVRDVCIKRDGDDSTFRTNVSAMYTQLNQLDGGPCTPSIQFGLSVPSGGAASQSDFTPQILPSFYDSDIAMNTAANFLNKFFVCFDKNRNALGNVYDPSAFFSIDMSLHLFKPPKYSTHKVKWSDYKSFNRNHTQTEVSSSPSQRLAFGNQMIIDLLSKLPTTTHQISDPSKVIVDSWMLPDLYPLGAGPGTPQGQYLYVVVHGEFTDSASNNLNRSFDRNFILKPALEGSPAAMEGWQVVIMSDTWTLRSYSNPKNFAPTPAPSTPVQPAINSTPAVTPSLPQPTPEQQSMLNALHQKTGLNYEYSFKCLSGNNWNLDQAYQNLLQLQANNQIPPEAFNK